MSRILIVDDDKATRDGLALALGHDYAVLTAADAEAALRALTEHEVDLVLTDLRMPGRDGLSLLRDIIASHPGLPVILLSAYGSVESAVEAMRDGAVDFLTKPVNLDHLELVVRRALRQKNLERQNARLRAQLAERSALDRLIGSSEAMLAVRERIEQVAPTPATVLIQGPSGTGKELVARALHALSPRSGKPFVAVHCAALAPSLLESELFGHVKGAFTGATEDRKGRFEIADGGTLFLDEISEIDLATQVKLLRVLETRTVEPVGSATPIPVDIRLVAATNRDLRAWVDAGKFREDLYFRLNVVDINLPPLRERQGDLPLLCDAFVREFNPQLGRGILGMTRKEEDIVQEMFVGSTHDYVLFVTDRGRLFRIKGYTIAEGSRTSKGAHIVNLLQLAEGEKVTNMLRQSTRDDRGEEGYVTMVTRQGLIKRTPLSQYANIRKSGLIAIALNEGDSIAWTRLTTGNDTLIVATRKGQAIRFYESDARPMGRGGHGVRAIRLEEGDEVVGVSICREGATVLTVTEQGKGRRTRIEDYRLTNRGGKGVRNYDAAKDKVAGIKIVDEADDVLLSSQEGVIIRMHAADITVQSRYGSGVRVMRLGETDRVTVVARTDHDDEAETAKPEMEAGDAELTAEEVAALEAAEEAEEKAEEAGQPEGEE